MKKFLNTLLLSLMVLTLSACGGSVSEQSAAQTAESGSSESKPISSETEEQSSSSKQTASDLPESSDEPGGSENTARRISVQFGENIVIYELNNGTAADSLYEQLPLTIEVEDYSTNENIFYPPEELDISDSPAAQAGSGTLAYYAPWGDVVMFYGNYSANPSLYELGQAVSGGEFVSRMSGTITVAAVE